MVYAVRPSYRRGDQGPVEAFGILSSAIISLALLPQYYEIYKHREVVGISVTFMTVDMLGGVFSDLSLAFKQKFDVIAAVTYSLVVVLDGIVIVLALILNPLAAKRRKRAALALTETDVHAEGSQAEVGRIVGASPNSRDSLGDRDLDVILEDRNTQLVLPKGDDGQEEKPHG
ncbi:hypothetical protein SCP_0905030 [Sparassis crispa]|uniref:Uncharacterized protein n=1 Tax=Sparassis crispa TaxID=139825 RepID=A0A401GXU8_9APHY|nr:hypothetical protein SCP_0905030 [Sparassis crispa]GBE86624.1 hypothetical protein SCP_0905030 [Sparassis crispa]